ncbi:endo-1,4-beta-xylanase [Isoptericola halotolerans]|uniref:endo-1,4-beta-xylanase n=1 Tax=Isoptericola halotolerans TaxID=300560 RepID=UPI0038907CC6
MRPRLENDYHDDRRTRRTTAAAAATALVGGTLLAGGLLLNPAQAAEPVHEPLRDAAERQGVTLGFALTPGHLNDSGYREIAEREIDLVVAENAMKWDATEPSQGGFSWGRADQVVAFADAQDADLYGHTLVWHSQLPGWVEGLTDPARLRDAMYDHIDAVVGQWQGGFQGEARLTNTGQDALDPWELAWDFSGGETVAQSWGGDLTQTGAHVTVTGPSWQTTLAPGQSTTVGFIGAGEPAAVTGLTANGDPCTPA